MTLPDQVLLDGRESTNTMAQRARKLFLEKDWIPALECFNSLAELEPLSAEVHNYRARVFESLDRHEDALESLNAALAINPKNIADMRNRAVVLTKLGRLSEAIANYDQALTERADDPDLLVRRAMLLNQVDRREEALADISAAVRLAPKDADVLNSRVIILDNLGRYTDAIADIDRMLQIKPDHIDAINNTGMLMARLGRFQESLNCYNRSLAIKPDQPQALYNRSLIRLALGDWIRGFQEFESRWNTAPLKSARLVGLGPLWLGEEELHRKTLLVYHEQGYGDTLQCVRYIPLLAARGAKVILAVPPALKTLMESLSGVTQVVTGDVPFPSHDYQTPLMSLPLAFRTTPDTVPGNVPYLSAEAGRVSAWRTALAALTRTRIGIAWGGRRYAPINYPRDIALAALRPLLSLDADFVSLQKEVAEEDRHELDRLPQLHRFDDKLVDFADTAALIANLDLVVTVDTAIAHLAGALGKPVWLMNRFGSCWRWLQQRYDSPWYPTMRQFRQHVVGDWTAVVIDVCEAVQTLVKAPGSIDALHSAVETPSKRRGVPTAPQKNQKIRFVSATRQSQEVFFAQAPLGRSLPLYRTFPKHQAIEIRLFAENTQGLPAIYNQAIEESRTDPAILVFIHDDVYLSDFYWAQHLNQALRHFDLVGVAGNRRRVPGQASWMYLDAQFTRDNYDNLSGVLGHGNPFPDLRQLSVYGEPGQEVKLLDGVMMAIRSETLIETGLRFDERFDFHFYDMDFCRQAELRKIRMGTWALSLVHASAGTLGVDSWRAAYLQYIQKYDELS